MAATNPRVYLGGRFSTNTKIEEAWLKRTGCKFRCFSFANVYPECVYYTSNASAAIDVCEKNNVGIMMDSGAFSFHKFAAQSKRRSEISDKKKDIDPEKLQKVMYRWYRDYCLENKKKWDFYLTLDYKPHQPTIFKMQKQFVKDGLMPIPVYHGDSDLDWLKRYKDTFGCKLISIGAISTDLRGHSYKKYRFFFDRVFEYGAKHGIKFHGLAVTSLGLITAYPWYSIDSSTWVQSSIYGMITFPDRDKNTIYNIHISERRTTTPVASYNNMPRRQRSLVEATIKEFGFTLKELRNGKEALDGRHDWNGKVFAHIFDLVDTTKQKHVHWERLI